MKKMRHILVLVSVVIFFHARFLSAQVIDENPAFLGKNESLFPEYEVEMLGQIPSDVDTVFPVVFNGSLYSFALGISGSVWKIFIGGDLNNPFSVHGGVVYFYDIYNRLYAIDLRTGRVLWKTIIRDELRGKPVVYRKYLIVSTLNGNIHVLIRSTGAPVYTYEDEDEIAAGLVAYDNVLIVPYKSGRLVAFDMNTRELLWKFNAGGIISISPVVKDETLYFGAWDGTFYALDVRTGTSRWVRYIGENTTRDFLVFEDMIVLFFSKGEVVSLRRRTGTIEWIKYFSGVDFNYNYFAGEHSLYIFLPDFAAFDPADGSLIFDYRERAFNLYKEMLFNTMVEGKNPLSDKNRIQLLSDVYFSVDTFPYLPPEKIGGYVYFVTTRGYLFVYDLKRDFFILKFRME